jgi:hypothetical protein
MIVFLLAPIAATFCGDIAITATGSAAWLAMSVAYSPVVRFYRLGLFWALTLPLAAALFLAMTWSSAFHYWGGTHGRWKSRSYDASLGQR